jgi:hypothetical protein
MPGFIKSTLLEDVFENIFICGATESHVNTEKPWPLNFYIMNKFAICLTPRRATYNQE